MSALFLFLLELAPGLAVAGGPMPVHLEVKPVPLNTDPEIKELPYGPPSAPARLSWLGCLQITASGPNSEYFGGISGSYVHGSRMMLVSDTTADGGSGRFFSGDIVLSPATDGAVNGAPVVPHDLQKFIVEPLRDEEGNVLLHDKMNGDTESLGVRWPSHGQPAKILIGVEREHKVRMYNLSKEHLSSVLTTQTPTLLGNGGEGTGIGKQLVQCARGEGNEENNFGAEGTAFVSETTVVVFCEYNKPQQPSNETVGWLADARTGEILSEYHLPLPPVEGLKEKFFRISSVVAVPGTSDLMVLFHYWTLELKSMIIIARTTLPLGTGAKSLKPISLKTHILVGPVCEREGFPIDNFETMNVVPTAADGTYVLHLLSDNNFNPKYQRTLMMTLLMEDVTLDSCKCSLASAATKEYLASGFNDSPSMSSVPLTTAAWGTVVAALFGAMIGAALSKRVFQRPGHGICRVYEVDEDDSVLLAR